MNDVENKNYRSYADLKERIEKTYKERLALWESTSYENYEKDLEFMENMVKSCVVD